MLSEFSLKDRVAVVTGGARGLGLEMMDALAEAGASVVAIDLLGDQACSAAEEVGKRHGVRSAAWAADVTNYDQTLATFETIEKECGPVDILVASAGIVIGEAAEESTPATWRKVIDVNVNGVFFAAQAAGRSMLARKRGSIVLIASMSGMIVNTPQKQASYNTSKGGVIMLAKSLAAEWAPYGVRVNALSPGYMRTAITDQVLAGKPGLLETWERLIPLGRMGEPRELRGAVVFLASDASSYVTGHSLVIDGGYTTW